MSYNLLFDSQLTGNRWKLNNCTMNKGYLTSTDNIFGIEQEIILPDPTKLYFRCKYTPISSFVDSIMIGIQNESVLSANKQWIKPGKSKSISVIDYAKQEKIKIQIIFESLKKENIIQLKEPYLCDLNRMHKSTWLKLILDKILKYQVGYSYLNLLPYSEITPNIFNLEPAKVGSLITTDKCNKFKINVPLKKGNVYLIKLDFEQGNKLGKTYFSYGMMRSLVFEDEQIFLLFRATDNQELFLNIDADDVLPYIVNLKHLLLIDMGGVNANSSDLPYLPFI